MNGAATDRIASLVGRCEAIADPALRADVLELLRLVLELHGEGLAALLQAASEAPHLEALLAAWQREPQIAALLEVHALVLPQRTPPPPRPHGDFVPVEALHL